MDVHKGKGSGSCRRMWTGGGGQKPDFFVDVINGWPLVMGSPIIYRTIDCFLCSLAGCISLIGDFSVGDIAYM